MTALWLLLEANQMRMKQRADEDPMNEADFTAYLQAVGWDVESLPVDYRKRKVEPDHSWFYLIWLQHALWN